MSSKMDEGKVENCPVMLPVKILSFCGNRGCCILPAKEELKPSGLLSTDSSKGGICDAIESVRNLINTEHYMQSFWQHMLPSRHLFFFFFKGRPGLFQQGRRESGC